MGNIEIENRLTAIETELAALKASSKAMPSPHPIHALDKIHGIFENDQAFKEAIKLGRKWRQSDLPQSRKSRVKRK